MDSRTAAMKELELKVERTLRMSDEEQIKVLRGLQEVLDELPEKDRFWIRTQRNRIYHNASADVKRLFNEVSDFYKCHKCGETVFCHDVTEVYEEEFNSEPQAVVEGKRYSDSKPWRCSSCNALIPGANLREFLTQIDDAR